MSTISEQELKQIIDSHGKWLRNEEGGQRANLRSADLSFANLSSANLSFADLSFADLGFANLRSADLSFANLRFANLRLANLSFAKLSFADLSFANLSSANLRSADLRVFCFQRHYAYYTSNGSLSIGCHTMDIVSWSKMYRDIGMYEQYTEEQIEAYGDFITNCLKHFKGGLK